MLPLKRFYASAATCSNNLCFADSCRASFLASILMPFHQLGGASLNIQFSQIFNLSASPLLASSPLSMAGVLAEEGIVVAFHNWVGVGLDCS
jgi:hypothetical protein